MKRAIIILSFMPIFLKSQIYTAGQILSGYVDIVPDTLINYWGGTESYSIDVNNDGQKDLRIEQYSTNGTGGTVVFIFINPLNSNCYTLLGRVDSVYNSTYNSWAVDNVAKPLSFGDTIDKAGSNWLNTSWLMISNNTNYVTTIKNIQDFVSPNDKFIGVKYQTSADTLFGWARVSVPVSYQCYLKDYSFSCSSPTVNCLTGMSEHTIHNKISVSPNPAVSLISISNEPSDFQNSEIEIANYLGQTVLKTNFKNQIDVSELTSGFYTLQLKDNSGSVITKKFIKE